MAPRNTHEENCRLSDVDQSSVMSPTVHLVESRAFETLGGIPQLTGRQIGMFENVSSHQPSSYSGQVHGRVQSLQFRFRGQNA